MRDDRLRLADMLEAIELIERYSRRGRAAFDEDELIRAWIVHHLEIPGEACRGLSDDFRKAHPDELWSDVVSSDHDRGRIVASRARPVSLGRGEPFPRNKCAR